jgi:hypothetical protein
VISDNYFPKQRSRTRRRTLGMFCSSTLHFPSFASIPIHPRWLQPRRLLHFTFASTGHCLEPPRAGSRFYSTHNTAPVLVSYGLLPHPSLGSEGSFAAENFPMWFSVVFLWYPTEFSHVVLCGRDTSASSSVTKLYKIPATSTSRLRAPCPGSATTSTFRTCPPAVRLRVVSLGAAIVL